VTLAEITNVRIRDIIKVLKNVKIKEEDGRLIFYG
jgi:hypothetical protein